MKRIRTQISISGFSWQEVEGGLQDLRDELGRRPWLRNTNAWWDGARQRLVVTTESEGDSLDIQGGDTGANLDEVSDCVIACIHFESEGIHFDVDSSDFVQE